MERKLATIQKIDGVIKHPSADSLDIVTIKGWKIVTKINEFQKDNLCVFVEIDSVMPEREEFEFLRSRNFRIRTIKLRGQISQGIAFPLSIISTEIQSVLVLQNPEGNIGTDVTEILGVEKYDPPMPACLGGVAKGKFPSHSIKTDEERIQNLTDIYEEYKQYTWVATEKLDGSSATFFIYDDEFGIASRNLTLKEHPEDEKNSFWKFARENDLEGKMRDFMFTSQLESLTLQGELYGSGIQKNPYKLKGQTVKFFRAFDPKVYEFYSPEIFMKSIEEMGLEGVPIISYEMKLPDTIEECIEMANGRSMLRDTAREGIVFVALDAPVDKYQGRLSFKVVSNKYILKNE